jgi:hypothetical protein
MLTSQLLDHQAQGQGAMMYTSDNPVAAQAYAVTYDMSKDQMANGLLFFVPPPPQTQWTILGDQSQILHVSIVSPPST